MIESLDIRGSVRPLTDDANTLRMHLVILVNGQPFEGESEVGGEAMAQQDVVGKMIGRMLTALVNKALEKQGVIQS